MNAVEQKNHRTAVQDLAQSCGSFAEATADRFVATDKALTTLSDAVNSERTRRLQLAIEQRGYVDARFMECWRAINGLRDRGFWSRINWLLTGR